MARYDRIAPLPMPDRARVFPAWYALADLEGRERDADLARRARLRFLALRPVRRLLRQGIDRVPVESFERQIEGVREELGHLSARDPERASLARFLHRIRERTPSAVVHATLEMGEVIESSGHYRAAEEYFLTAFELAEACGLGEDQTTALRLVGRLCRKAARWDDAEAYYRQAIARAEAMGQRRQWARAMDGLAIAYAYRGNYPKARVLLEEVLERGRAWKDDYIVATALSSLSTNALTAGDYEQALEYGWTAIGLMDSEEARHPILGNLGRAFAQLGLFRAAERCYEIIIANAQEVVPRNQAKADYALIAAEAGNVKEFRARRERLLNDAAEWREEPWVGTWVHLHVGRACVLVGDVDDAREHLRTAIALATKHRYNEQLIRAEETLELLEAAVAGARPPAPAAVGQPGAVAVRIAEEVEACSAASLEPATA
jgi:tetratricopeptide (TPR) repeat protein